VKNRSPSCSLSLMWLEFAKQTRADSSEKSYQPPCHVHYDNTVNLIIIVYIARREKVFSAQYFKQKTPASLLVQYIYKKA
jgi:hypothetical protein